MTTLEQQIRDAYALERRPDAPVRDERALPLSYEQMQTGWLTRILCTGVPGAAVTGYRLDAPDNGTNNRRRVYLDYNAAGQAAGLPPSVFCKATHDLNNRLMLGHSGAILCEVTFYNRARALLDIEAPRALFAAYDPVSFNSMVVLEDLDGKARFSSEETAVDRVRIEQQLDLLAALHSRFYQARELTEIFAPLPVWYDRFYNLARFRLEESCATGVREAEAVIPARLFARQQELWPLTLQSLEQLKHLPHALCHGDVHLKNWYETSDDRIGLGDWGVTHKGHWSRDLVYMITTSLGIDQRRRWERELIDYYRDAMARRGVPAIDRDQALLWYRQASMTALAFWTMTLKPDKDLPDMQPPATALCFISRLAHMVDDLDVLDAVRAG